MIIRQFHQNDTYAILQLANSLAFFDGPLHEEDLTITHAFPEGFIVAEENERIIGFVYGYFRDIPTAVLDTWGVSKVATIELLVVNPKYRKKGIGKLLLESLIDTFRQSGSNMIGLTCPIEAENARQLYEKLGFEISAYHMRKRLD